MMDSAPTPTPSELLDDITGRAQTLRYAMNTWATRDETKAQPGVRHAANVAVLAVDGMLRGLHALRQALIDEMRQTDDATARRVDALLARRREDGAR